MKLIPIALAAHGINESVALYFLAALQFHKNTIAHGVDPNVCHLLRQTKRDTKLAQVVGQRFEDLPIQKLQKDCPLVKQRNIGAQSSHKGCVLETDHAGSH